MDGVVGGRVMDGRGDGWEGIEVSTQRLHSAFLTKAH